ncbi:CHAT domain-containing protein [Parasphingorhabdus pacifica]
MVSTLDFDALPWVTEVFRATVSVLADFDPARPGVLNNLGTTSQLAFVRSKETGDLEDAVSYYRKAASTAREDDPDLVLYQCNLALALAEQAAHTNDPSHALESVRAARTATERTSRRDQRRMMALMRLGNALKLHARLADDTDSDDESIDVFREAMRGMPGNPAETSELLINLGSALLRRYERGGPLEDLREGVNHLRSGIDGMSDGAPRRAAACQLAVALRLSFHAGGDLVDLNAAVNELLGVLGVLNPGNALLGQVMWRLSAATSEHADCTGEPGQLRRVVSALGPAMRGIADHDEYRADALAGYGALLRRNFVYGAEIESLNAALSFGEAAAESATEPTRRCAVLVSLAMSLITRYEHSGNIDDLDLAETHADRAANAVPDGASPQHAALNQLGLIAAHRFRRTSGPEHLDTAVEMFERALNGMSETAPGRAAVATDLGRALRTMHQRTGRRRLYRWARRVLAEAANQPTAPVDQRLRAATLGGRLAAQSERWPEALESFTTAVELLPLATQGKQVVASPRTQQQWALITADAAACALETGVPEQAVELLEHGRSALLSDFLPAGGEIGELHRTAPELADGIVRLRRLLDRPPEEPALVDLESWAHDDRAELAQAWTDMLAEVRHEHPDYLQVSAFRKLAPAGADGPVVLVNLSRYRTDALLVFGGRVLPTALPSNGVPAAAEQAANLLSSVERQDFQVFEAVLHWLWHNVARPVLDRMGYTRTPKDGDRWPRVWWSTSGPLAFLPVHAAAADSGHGVMDRVVSSYTPTLGTLLRAKQQPLPDDGRALLAAGSQEQIGRELPQQNQIVAQHWPTAEVATVESTGSPDFMRMLPHHPWVHICERSVQYPGQPAAGVVLDREAPQRPLTLVELGQTPLENSEFAYLGQCTTVIDTPSPAANTLPGALAFAGVTHVIGTLWGLDDFTANRLHGDMYEQLFGGGEFATDLSAYAVHRAATRMRAEFPGDPARWAAHVHVGP